MKNCYRHLFCKRGTSSSVENLATGKKSCHSCFSANLKVSNRFFCQSQLSFPILVSIEESVLLLLAVFCLDFLRKKSTRKSNTVQSPSHSVTGSKKKFIFAYFYSEMVFSKEFWHGLKVLLCPKCSKLDL